MSIIGTIGQLFARASKCSGDSYVRLHSAKISGSVFWYSIAASIWKMAVCFLVLGFLSRDPLGLPSFAGLPCRMVSFLF